MQTERLRCVSLENGHDVVGYAHACELDLVRAECVVSYKICIWIAR